MLDPKNSATIYIIRHGRTEANDKGIIQGHHDSPLTEEGVKQASRRMQDLTDVKFDSAFSSDTLRAFRTAEIVLAGRGLQIEAMEDLRERYWGKYESAPAGDYREENKHRIEEYYKLPADEQWDYKIFDDMETTRSLFTRFSCVLKKIGENAKGKTVAVFTHSGTMRTLLLHLGNELFSGDIENLAYIKILCDGKNFEVLKTEGITPRVDPLMDYKNGYHM